MDYRFKPSARGRQVTVISLVFILLAALPAILNAIIPEDSSTKQFSKIELSAPDSEWKIPIHNGDDSEIVCAENYDDPSALRWDCGGTIVSSKIVFSKSSMETITRRMLRAATFSNSALDAEVIEKNRVFLAGLHTPFAQATAIAIQGTGDHKEEVLVTLVQGNNYEIMADLIWKRLSKSGKLPQFEPNPTGNSQTPMLPPHLPGNPDRFGDAV